MFDKTPLETSVVGVGTIVIIGPPGGGAAMRR
jgi:hypothetical protein